MQPFSLDSLWAIRARDMQEAALQDIYARMDADGLADVVFYNGGITGPASFANFATGHGLELRTVYHGNEPVGVVWINNALGLACMTHFCILRRFWPWQREIGIWTVRRYLEPLNPATGAPYLTALYGLTPKAYRHALRFIQSIGFRLLGVLPGACEFQGPHGPVYRDGMTSVLTLADIPNE